MRCHSQISKLLEERGRIAEQIVQLEVKLVAGGLTAREDDALAGFRDRLSSIDDALTLTADPEVIDHEKDGTARVRPLDYKQWFAPINRADLLKMPGDDGVLIRWKINATARDALTQGAYVQPGDVSGLSSAPDAVVYYRRPVPVGLSMVPCTANGNKHHEEKPIQREDAKPEDYSPTCIIDLTPESAALSTNTTAGFPQLSGLFRLPIGRGGLFGSRSVAAEFDENGAPTMLKYGTDPGAADLASVIDAAREGGTTLRDAKADALARRAAMLKSRKDIQDLEAALDKQQ